MLGLLAVAATIILAPLAALRLYPLQPVPDAKEAHTDGIEVHAIGRDELEALGEVEADLPAEDAVGGGQGALVDVVVVEHVALEFLVQGGAWSWRVFQSWRGLVTSMR